MPSNSVDHDLPDELDTDEWEELKEKDFEELTDSEINSKIRLSIERRFDSPEWVKVYEYTADNGRRADCIAVNTFPSRNYKIVGFEFKASRSDWLSELKDTSKADPFIQIVDEWYVVAGGTDIVEESELPDGWGFLELKPNSEQLYKIRESELTEYQQGEPDREFWGLFLRKAVGDESNYSAQDVHEARRRGYEEGYDEGSERGESRARREVSRKAENWEKLEEAGLDDIGRLSDSKIQRLSEAQELIQRLDEDGYWSVRDDYEDLVDAVLAIEAPLQRLERLFDDDPSDGSDQMESD